MVSKQEPGWHRVIMHRSTYYFTFAIVVVVSLSSMDDIYSGTTIAQLSLNAWYRGRVDNRMMLDTS